MTLLKGIALTALAVYISIALLSWGEQPSHHSDDCSTSTVYDCP